MATPSDQITQILDAMGTGDADAEGRLLPLVYDELRGIARAFMAKEKPGQTLQPTALVHEAYIRLLGKDAPRWDNRAHFFTAAAEAMRRILIENARRKTALKRGGGQIRVTLGDVAEGETARFEELLALNEALDRLEERDAEMAQVVKLRYFAGLTVEETAKALDTSTRSVNRHWTAARAWLRRELSRAGGRAQS